MQEELVSHLPQLSAEEIRVLGCLIEKSKVTPDYYPMTINGLKNACNQKTSRTPIVDYSDAIVTDVIGQLKSKGFVSSMIGGGSRVVKYKHNLGSLFSLDPVDLSILCLLMLRGPLTIGEINSNSGRLYDFENLDEITERIEQLSESKPAFIKMLERRPGQKENRYIQLFSDFDETNFNFTNTTSLSSPSEIESLKERVATLEEELQQLRAEFNDLMEQLS